MIEIALAKAIVFRPIIQNKAERPNKHKASQKFAFNSKSEIIAIILTNEISGMVIPPDNSTKNIWLEKFANTDNNKKR